MNPRATYFRQFIKPKKLLLWTLSDPSDDDSFSLSFNKFVSYLEGSLIGKNALTRVDPNDYDYDFNNFYRMEIAERYDETIKAGHRFCSNPLTGGVSTGYVIDTANEEKNATILSVDLLENGMIDEVYALITFRVSKNKKAIKIHTLCGNQVMTGSGEGTRLLNLIKESAYLFGINKIFLDPLEDAVKYYEKLKFRPAGSSSSQETLESDESPPIKQMKLNTKAQKRWMLAKNGLKVFKMFNDMREATARVEQEKLDSKYKEEQRIAAINKAIADNGGPRRTVIVPGATLKMPPPPSLHPSLPPSLPLHLSSPSPDQISPPSPPFVPRRMSIRIAEKRIPSKKIIPGESLQNAKIKKQEKEAPRQTTKKSRRKPENKAVETKLSPERVKNASRKAAATKEENVGVMTRTRRRRKADMNLHP